MLAIAGGLAVLAARAPSAQAGPSPDAWLRVCERDGKNLADRVTRYLETAASSQGSTQERALSDAENQVERYEQQCIEGDQAEAIKGMPGYAAVLRRYQEVHKQLQNALGARDREQKRVADAAVSAAPGGDKDAIEARWRHAPERCRSPEAWDAARGVVASAGPRSRISGLDDEDAAKAEPSPHWMFSDRPSHGFLGKYTPPQLLARTACGKEVEGIDPYFREKYIETGDINNQYGDARAILALAILNDAPKRDEQIVYRALLAHHCFAATEWNAKIDYVPYLFCRQTIDGIPSVSEVVAAWDRLYPDRAYERANLRFMTERATRLAGELDRAMAKVEARYPMMKSLYRDTPERIARTYRERLESFSWAYEVLDPITATLERDPQARVSENCEAQLLPLRRRLIDELRPRTEEDAFEVRAGHPVGYQVSEALAFCYLGRRKFAKARLEAEALGKTNRRISLSEEMFYEMQKARDELREKLRSEQRFAEEVPGDQRGHLTYSFLGVRRSSADFAQLARGGGNLAIRGDRERQPAVVVKKKAVAGGVQLTFKKHPWRYTYQPQSCRDTKRVQRYDISSDGRSVTPVYQQSCHAVGKPKTERGVYQEDPVVIPKEDAELVSIGEQVRVIVNSKAVGDAAVLDVWKPSNSAPKYRVKDGIPLR